MKFDIYLLEEDRIRVTFAGEPLWHGNTFYTNPQATVDEGEEFAIINYYCDGDSDNPTLLYCDNFVDVDKARNKEWVKARLNSVIEDNEYNMGCELHNRMAVVNIYKCKVGVDDFSGKDAPELHKYYYRRLWRPEQ